LTLVHIQCCISYSYLLTLSCPKNPGPRTFDQRSLCQIYLHTCYYTYSQQVLKLAKIKQNCLWSVKQHICGWFSNHFDSSAILICVYSQNISLANVFSHLVVVISAPLCPDNYMFILMQSSSIDYFRVVTHDGSWFCL
jgi:hypothetical protein